ncbi:hypothetical protein [Qingrenia yutianensis]|uniref:Uncharacterized protein n=1 Tax=Qingrenia yutianensis TaxID=2763676 RepID=A0A926FF65_9FIRM|nr:hypothetical protein [Qingrenia yutianensis]MBC8597159.1 hypothetical protein [Qingrenia yutianensis]
MESEKVRLFKKKVDIALRISKDDLRRRKNDAPGESTIEQLEETIIPEMEKLLKMDYDNLPPAKDRYLVSFAYAFRVWEWSMVNTTRLFDLLVELNREYKEL